MVDTLPEKFLELIKGWETPLYGAFHLCGLANACINPFLYGYLNENFRKEYKNVYR